MVWEVAGVDRSYLSFGLPDAHFWNGGCASVSRRRFLDTRSWCCWVDTPVDTLARDCSCCGLVLSRVRARKVARSCCCPTRSGCSKFGVLCNAICGATGLSKRSIGALKQFKLASSA